MSKQMYLQKSVLLAALLFLVYSHGYTQSNTSPVILKFGKGLSIAAADSSMQLKISARFQPKFEYQRSLTEGAEAATDLVIRRARLKFDGWAYTPNLVYKIELGLSPRDLKSSTDLAGIAEGIGAKVVLDAVMKWKFQKNWTLWAGQTKLPGNIERIISSQKLQFVDRSILNGKFTLDRDVGLQLHGKYTLGKAVLQPIFALSMGEGRNIVIGNTGGFQYTGKLEFFPFGKFDPANLDRSQTPQLALAAAYDFNNGASREQGNLKKFLVDTTGNVLTADLSTFFAEMVFKYQGFSTLVEYANRDVSQSGLGFDTGSGINVAMGYLLPSNFEFALRYSNISPDADRAFNEETEYTLGISKYIVGHNLKLQTDFSLIEEEGTESNAFRYRFQFEFAF